jgi:cystathionine gamma-lyase
MCVKKPLELGADISLQSLTKYLNGHSDVTMGALTLNSETWAEQIKFNQYTVGAVPSPFDCYLVSRGLKTLSIRMREHMRNGLAVAKALDSNGRVEKVVYPGLESHPQHELYKKQMTGFGGMIVIYIKGGLKEANTFANSLKVLKSTSIL